MLVIAADCSERTKKDYIDKCRFYEIKYIIYGTKQELGIYTGNNPAAAVGICDEGFAELISCQLSVADN